MKSQRYLTSIICCLVVMPASSTQVYAAATPEAANPPPHSVALTKAPGLKNKLLKTERRPDKKPAELPPPVVVAE